MSARDKIKVLLVDNHPLVLDGLRKVLETFSHIEIVGTAGLALTGLEIARKTQPSVVLMDINMPKLNGIDAIELFKRELPKCQIVMLSMHDTREYISSSVLRGAAGYVLKDVPTGEIVAAIEAVADGGTYFSSGVREALVEPKPADLGPLTIRERDVLLLIADGKSNREIAQSFNASVATVETHRKNLKKKLGVTTTAGLVRYALDRGLGKGNI
jgi:two-component system, NarL family, nitrate/nitrite response regulator NarL